MNFGSDMNYEVLSLLQSSARARGALETLEEGMYDKVRGLFWAVESDILTAKDAADSMNEDLRKVREMLEKSEAACQESIMSFINQPYQSCPELVEEISVLQTKNMELINELMDYSLTPDDEDQLSPEQKLELDVEHLLEICLPLCQIRFTRYFLDYDMNGEPLDFYEIKDICTEVILLEDKIRSMVETDPDIETIMRQAAGNAYVDQMLVKPGRYEKQRADS